MSQAASSGGMLSFSNTVAGPTDLEVFKAKATKKVFKLQSVLHYIHLVSALGLVLDRIRISVAIKENGKLSQALE